MEKTARSCAMTINLLF